MMCWLVSRTPSCFQEFTCLLNVLINKFLSQWRSEGENYGDLVGTAKKDSRGKRKIGKGHGRGSITQETIGKTSFDVLASLAHMCIAKYCSSNRTFVFRSVAVRRKRTKPMKLKKQQRKFLFVIFAVIYLPRVTKHECLFYQ